MKIVQNNGDFVAKEQSGDEISFPKRELSQKNLQ
jgi:hypothetical protein